MTRTLIIQLGRLGDVIQTTPLLADLAARGDEVDVLVLHSTHTAITGCPAVQNIITIADALKPLDDAIALGFPHGQIPAEAFDLLAALRLPLYDRVINASHAPLGCWLAAEIPSANPEARFGGVIRDGECLYLGAASAYRIAMLQFREQNLCNLVDLIRAIPAVATQPTHPRLYANKSSELPLALPHGRRVALNPGASDAVRRWPAENFARLAEALSAAGCVPLLVGAPSDRDLCGKIAAAAHVTIPNLAGRTTIPEMAALLARCDLLVSSDTGAAHLAAAVGTTVVGLYGATAWFTETAPYGDDHIILQAPLNVPISTISVEAAVAAARNRLGQLSTCDLRRELLRRNQSAWETSVVAPCLTDPLGGLTYRPVQHDSSPVDEFFARSLRRALAKEFFAPAGIAGGMKIHDFDPRSNCDSLTQILGHMQTIANVCTDSIEKGIGSRDVQAAAKTLISAMERIRALANDPKWIALSPVIHNLDWQLRVLPKLEPAAIFRAHAQAYAMAARILRNASANQRESADRYATIQREIKYLRGSLSKGEKRGDRCLIR